MRSEIVNNLTTEMYCTTARLHWLQTICASSNLFLYTYIFLPCIFVHHTKGLPLSNQHTTLCTKTHTKYGCALMKTYCCHVKLLHPLVSERTAATLAAKYCAAMVCPLIWVLSQWSYYYPANEPASCCTLITSPSPPFKSSRVRQLVKKKEW